MGDVFITKTSIYLPNEAVQNQDMEKYLGQIKGKSSKSKEIVLRNNGIQQRYYALDQDGNSTHTNAELTALAVRNLFTENPDNLKNIQSLSCGTTSPDQMLPSHAVMVHGLLPETNHIEVTSNTGACCSGMHALKFAFLSVKSGEVSNAIATGSERMSVSLRSESFIEEFKTLELLKSNPYIAFEKDFLRWMLSDGAGAFLLQDKPSENGISFKIEWIELFSYANEKEVCMYMGADKSANGTFKTLYDFSPKEIMEQSVLSIKQDIKMLRSNIVALGFNGLKDILNRRGMTVDDIDYLLPHISSYYFRDIIFEVLQKNETPIPIEKWFTNLKNVGNVGAGSIYLMLNGLQKEKSLKKGDKILLAVPESARFSYAFAMLTVC